MLIDGIRLLHNLQMANSDGIDPDHCKNVRISNCHIECGDDAIVLKNSGEDVYKRQGQEIHEIRNNIAAPWRVSQICQ